MAATHRYAYALIPKAAYLICGWMAGHLLQNLQKSVTNNVITIGVRITNSHILVRTSALVTAPGRKQQAYTDSAWLVHKILRRGREEV